MQISSLVGKSVLSRTGEWLGYVVALRLTRDMKKLSCLVCADGDEEEFYLPARAVLAAEDAVIAGRQRLQAPTGTECPVGRPVYTHTGEFCGVIADMVPGDAPELIVAAEKKERRFPIACTALGETVIVYPTAEERRRAGGRAGKPAAAGTRKKRPAAAASKQPAPAQSNPAQPAQAVGRGAALPSDDKRAEEEQTRGGEYRLDRTNLLGRRVKRSVYDAQGQPVALAGERITPEVIARARRGNRLLALTVNTLTNLY